MNEVWKDIKDYEGLYQVSNLGRVKSLQRIVSYVYGERMMEEKILKGSICVYGYLRVNLRKNGINKTIKIHKLVAQTFISNPDNKETVNHINGIKTDNRVKNLEFCTRRENNLHAYKTGLKCQRGENNSSSKLTENEVFVIRGLLEYTSLKLIRISEIFEVSGRSISNIKYKRTWKHLK